MNLDKPTERIICGDCGSEGLYSIQSENGTFFGYECDKCDGENGVLEHFDGGKWKRV